MIPLEKVKTSNIRAFRNSFKKNKSTPNAVLAIDTTTSKAELILFHEKDTATISINSILLSEHLKNLDTMKTKILTLAATAGLFQATSAQNAQGNTTATPAPAKKIVIGAGISVTGYFTISDSVTFIHAASNGAQFKFDYPLTNKFSAGLKSTFTIRKKNMHYTGDVLEYTFNKGNNYNFMFTSTYYIFGKNTSEGKGGFYTTLGAGYSAANLSQTITSNAPISDTLYYKYSEDFGSKNFSGLVCLGGNCKLGPGRIYSELLQTVDIWGTVETKFYNQSGTANKVDQKKTGLRDVNNTEIFLNIGYQLYF